MVVVPGKHDFVWNGNRPVFINGFFYAELKTDSLFEGLWQGYDRPGENHVPVFQFVQKAVVQDIAGKKRCLDDAECESCDTSDGMDGQT